MEYLGFHYVMDLPSSSFRVSLSLLLLLLLKETTFKTTLYLLLAKSSP